MLFQSKLRTNFLVSAPKDEESPLLEPSVVIYYMQLIGILRWMCELGRINICTEVSILYLFSVMPHEGHLEVALHKFFHLKSQRNSRLIFDLMEPKVGNSDLWSASGLTSIQVHREGTRIYYLPPMCIMNHARPNFLDTYINTN
jgi:hypothetical protein